MSESEVKDGPGNFVRELVEADKGAGKHGGRVMTRFPPEPNGYLHLGHSKSLCLNFGLAAEFGGVCNLRFDDTNPVTEDVEYVESIKNDIRWLGFDWQEREYYASDYFEQLYGFARQMVLDGKAYVDSQTKEELREARGDYYRTGKPSPYRDRPVAENLDLFERMRKGEFPDGAHVLRARTSVDHPNMNMRDPLMYRIKHAHHHRTGDAWCIYPTYDWAHGQSDAIEGITHSICTLEFEDHRPLYDWFLDQCPAPADTGPIRSRPQQIEFAKLALTYTVMSKRRLLIMVKDGHVSGWDDPRMPTLAGVRRRGITAAALRNFCERIGVARREQMVDIALLEHAIREDLNATSPRVLGVLRPLKIVIDNFPEGETEWFDAPLHPEDPSYGSRKVPLSREVYIEREDFKEDAPKKWFRLAPGREIRLRYACLITCREVIKDAAGEVVELRCTWDPDSRGGNAPDGRKVKGTSHWVSARHAVDAEVRLYDRLFAVEDPMGEAGEGDGWKKFINPSSLEVVRGAKVEPYLRDAQAGSRWQFERIGYFCVDRDSQPGAPVFNRTIGLRDSWAKIEGKTED